MFCPNTGTKFREPYHSNHVIPRLANCKADCCLCSSTILNGYKVVQCDGCELWIHNECSFISEDDYENVLTTRCTWICPKCDFFNVLDSFFDDQLNLMTSNRFETLPMDKNVRLSSISSKETDLSTQIAC